MALPPHPPPPGVQLGVCGTIPPGLTGRLTAVGDGVAHSLEVLDGRVNHVARALETTGAVRDLISVDGSVLASTDDADVLDLSATGASRRVDLAGPGRSLVTSPMLDPATGELHLAARGAGGDLEHVVVSAGRLTRRNELIDHAPPGVHGLALTSDHIVVVADHAIGIVPRSGDRPAVWLPTETPVRALVHARDADDAVELLVLAPSLERWIIRSRAALVKRAVVDATPMQFARTASAHGVPTSVWSTSRDTISRHDLRKRRSTHRDLTPKVPGDFVLAPGAERAGDDDGWFVGLVHDSTARTTDVHVIDTADPALLPIASFLIDQRLPLGARCAWTPRPDSSRPTDGEHTQEYPS